MAHQINRSWMVTKEKGQPRIFALFCFVSKNFETSYTGKKKKKSTTPLLIVLLYCAVDTILVVQQKIHGYNQTEGTTTSSAPPATIRFCGGGTTTTHRIGFFPRRGPRGLRFRFWPVNVPQVLLGRVTLGGKTPQSPNPTATSSPGNPTRRP